MQIEQILQELKIAKHPVAKAIHKGQQCKVLAIGFNKEMVLKAHQAYQPSTLLVLEGKLIYKEKEKEITLNKMETLQIPINTLHDVTAMANSLCLLIQG